MKQRILKIIFLSVIIFLASVQIIFAKTIGESESFNVDSNYDSDNQAQLEATLNYISKSAYFYIDSGWWNSLSSYQKTQTNKSIMSLAAEFESTIYPTLTDFFGSVFTPGIDKDSRITILISDLKQGIGGYFDSCHQYPKSQCSHSNEREMIHVNADFIFTARIKDFLAHELQHLINWNQKDRLTGITEDVWLNELRSEYVPTLLNYDSPYSGSILEMRINDFLSDFRNPLGEWKGNSGDYGAIALLGQYFDNQFGENIFSFMAKNRLIGIESINGALKEAGYVDNFDSVFTNWSLANYYNSLSIGSGGKYGYTNPDLKKIHVSPTTNKFSSYSIINFSEKVKDWSPRWYLLENKLPIQESSVALKIEFSSSDSESDFWVPYIVNYKNGEYELGFINLEKQSGSAYIFNFAKDVDSVLIVPANHSKRDDFSDSDPTTTFNLTASTVFVNQPIITNISPSKGHILGGNMVEINGNNFQNGIEVYFAGTKASNISFINENLLEVTVPPNNEGLVNVWVKNPDGKNSVFAQGYEYSSEAIVDGSLIRAKGDYKVYIIQGQYKRHIIDSRIFDFYGHLNWSNIIEVTAEERDSYQDSAWVRADGDKKVYEVNGDKTKHWLNMTAEQFYISGRRWPGVFIVNKQERDFYTTGSDVLYR